MRTSRTTRSLYTGLRSDMDAPITFAVYFDALPHWLPCPWHTFFRNSGPRLLRMRVARRLIPYLQRGRLLPVI